MTKKLKKIIIVLVVLVVGFVLWAAFFRADPEIDPLITGASGGSRTLGENQILGTQITRALNQIKSLDLDKSVFTNPLFVSLKDRSKIIQKEPIGRRNPFAPLSDTSVNFNSSVSGIDFGASDDSADVEDNSATTTPVDGGSGSSDTGTTATTPNP